MSIPTLSAERVGIRDVGLSVKMATHIQYALGICNKVFRINY